MTREAILTPAYGADYRKPKEAVAAFNIGRDFILHDRESRWDGKPCNIRDLNKYGNYTKIKIRFNRLQDFIYLTREGDKW